MEEFKSSNISDIFHDVTRNRLISDLPGTEIDMCLAQTVDSGYKNEHHRLAHLDRMTTKRHRINLENQTHVTATPESDTPLKFWFDCPPSKQTATNTQPLMAVLDSLSCTRTTTTARLFASLR